MQGRYGLARLAAEATARLDRLTAAAGALARASARGAWCPRAAEFVSTGAARGGLCAGVFFALLCALQLKYAKIRKQLNS